MKKINRNLRTKNNKEEQPILDKIFVREFTAKKSFCVTIKISSKNNKDSFFQVELKEGDFVYSNGCGFYLKSDYGSNLPIIIGATYSLLTLSK